MKTREEIVFDMCMTHRHDFGLTKESGMFGAGLTTDEREFLLREMNQQYEHNIAPLVNELQSLYNGESVVVPRTKEHAESMLKVANFYLDHQ